jgi:hypothetical protein
MAMGTPQRTAGAGTAESGAIAVDTGQPSVGSAIVGVAVAEPSRL